MSGGKLVFGGTPEGLAAGGEGHGGGAPVERGRSAVLSAALS